jgi:hypothetical protein
VHGLLTRFRGRICEKLSESFEDFSKRLDPLAQRKITGLRPIGGTQAPPIISASADGIAQNLVCPGDFLKSLLGPFIFGIFVGMVLESESTIGRLDGILIRISRYTQNFVWISMAHRRAWSP